MTRKLNPQGLINEERYVFPDQVKYKDQIYNVFKEVALRNNIHCEMKEEIYKSGSMLINSKDRLLTIDGGFKPFCVLGATTYGNYLIVTLYTLVEDNFINKMLSASTRVPLSLLAGGNMIECRDIEAFVYAISAVLQETFAELSLKEKFSNELFVNDKKQEQELDTNQLVYENNKVRNSKISFEKETKYNYEKNNIENIEIKGTTKDDSVSVNQTIGNVSALQNNKHTIIIMGVVIFGLILFYGLSNSNKSSNSYDNHDFNEEYYESDEDSESDDYGDEYDEYIDEDDADYILPQSSDCYLTDDDLAGLSKEELRLARNEIYARYGYIFLDASLNEYFKTKTWYEPVVYNDAWVDEEMLNEYEIYNRDLIVKYELQMGYR